KGHQTCTRTDPTQCAVCGSTNIAQDEDVLDTWFSSALWPFSTLGWPDRTSDLEYFYPTSVLETGYDILFFWVARMIMMGLECTGQVPFHHVYLHGLIRHKDGSKISKSNPEPGDNPLDVIADYSADALRFTIITSSAPGNDTKLDMEKVEHARNFANKIWNMTRFIVSSFNATDSEGGNGHPRKSAWLDSEHFSLSDRWILSRLNHLIAGVNASYAKWDFGEGTRQIHEFLWSEFADWYIEASKIPLNGPDKSTRQRTSAILEYILDNALRLLHPTMPFVTEEAWQHLRRLANGSRQPDEPEALIIAPWPKANRALFNVKAERDFTRIMEIIRAIRNARTEFNVEPGKRIPAIISAGSARGLIESQRDVVATLARLDPSEFRVEVRAERPEQTLAIVVGKVEIYLPLAGMIDLEREKTRLASEIAKVNSDITRAEGLLAGEFSKRAPKEVVQKTRDTLGANRERVAKLDTQLAGLEGRVIKTETAALPAVKKKPVRKTAKRVGIRSAASRRGVRKTTAKKTSKNSGLRKRLPSKAVKRPASQPGKLKTMKKRRTK
ncbi:MAG TPA: class I tRNA ligase family protein, partial [Anaerolineae bacterium]